MKIIEHLPDPTFAIDKNGVVIAWNRAMEKFSGFLKSDILSKGDKAYTFAIYGDKREILVDFLLNSKDPDPCRYTSIKRYKDGISGYAKIPTLDKESIQTAWIIAGVLSDQDGNPYGSIVTIRDISLIISIEEELKSKQEALANSYEELAMSQEELRESYGTLAEWKDLLEESELKYRTLVENSNDAIFRIQDSRYLFVNATCSAMSGYSEGDIYEIDIWRTISAADQEGLRTHVQMVLNGSIQKSRYIAPILTQSGLTKIIEFSFNIIQYNGKPALLGRGRDVSERVRAEQALIQANQKLHLLSSITRHDIKNHLTSLQSALSVVHESDNEEDNEVLLNIAIKSAKSIDQAISFTALYQEIGISEPIWADVEDSFLAYADIARSAGIDLKIIPPFGIEIYVDPLFSRVCYNLIENCIRHADSVTSIIISSDMRDGNLRIYIKDNGCGVAHEEKMKIFLRGHGKNTGMGLFLVREILRITEIDIFEIGIPGTGAIFELIIPAGRYRSGEMDSQSESDEILLE